MRVLVCGGRRYRNKARVDEVLDGLDPPATKIVHGFASGADTLAKEWADARGILVQGYAANWSDLNVDPLVMRYDPEDGRPYNAAAGGIRNQRMLDEEHPDLVIAFPGGTGTADMVRRAKAAGVTVNKVV